MVGMMLNTRYELKRELASHPLFKVFGAKDRVTSKDICIRILKDRYKHVPAVRDALYQAVHESHSLHHPCLEKLHEVLDSEGDLLVLSDLYRGELLSVSIPKLAPFTPSLSIELVLFIGEALDEMHLKQLVHGHVTPASIAVSQDGAVKLLHPGFWDVYTSCDDTMVAMFFHLFPYLSPEFYSDSGHSKSSDIYALGAVFYELLTGKVPFIADSYEGYKEKHISAPVPKICAYYPDVPESYEWVIKKCLAKSPEDRYECMRSLIADLRCIRDAMKFGKKLSLPSKIVGRNDKSSLRKYPFSSSENPMKRNDKNNSEQMDYQEKTDVLSNQKVDQIEHSKENLLRIGSQVRNSALKNETRNVAPAMGAVYSKESKLSRKRKSSANTQVPKWLLNLVYLCLCGVFVVLGGWIYFNLNAPKKHVMPDITGLSVYQTKDKLKDLNLSLNIQKRETNEKFPAGTILDVNPQPGFQVKEGSTINVTVSQGSKFVQLPDFRGLLPDEAKTLAANVGIEVEEMVERIPSGAYAVNRIAKQTPVSSSKMERGRSVKIWVSSGLPKHLRNRSGPSYKYNIKINVTKPVLVRVDMTDEVETKTIYEKLHHEPGKIEEVAEGYGNQSVFRVYYDGVLQRTIPITAKQEGPKYHASTPKTERLVETKKEINQKQEDHSGAIDSRNSRTLQNQEKPDPLKLENKNTSVDQQRSDAKEKGTNLEI